MQRSMVTWGILCAIMAARPVPARAQSVDMSDGTWHGWLMQTDQDSIRVSYAVSHYDKHLLITLRGRSGIIYDMSDAKVKDDVLTFDWLMGGGSWLYCRLTRRDGRSFEGTCNDRAPGPTGKGLRVWMLMTPPGRDSTRGG
jgi:hypothetical protein